MNTRPYPKTPHERLYELLEVLRPDFDQQEDGGVLAVELASSDEQARRLREGDDLAEAREELAELLEKHPSLIDSRLIDTWHEIARVDDLLGDAVQDVAVPEHLRQQILEELHSHKAAVRAKVSLYERFSERFIAFTAPVVVLVLAVFVWWLSGFYSEGLQKDQVLAIASRCFTEEASPAAKSLAGPLSGEERSMLKNFTPSEDVLSPNAATWERVDYKTFATPAVVYRFKDEHGNQAALFVIREPRQVKGLIDRPPRRPQLTTAGRSVGAWQSDDLVYVLVSSGNENAWRSLLVPQRPVT